MKTRTNLKTLKVRVRDKHAKQLSQWAFECNQIWNAANDETANWSAIPIPEVGYMFFNISAYDLAKQQAKIAKERGFTIHSQTIQEVTEERLPTSPVHSSRFSRIEMPARWSTAKFWANRDCAPMEFNSPRTGSRRSMSSQRSAKASAAPDRKARRQWGFR